MSTLQNSNNQYIDIVGKTSISLSNFADYYLVNQSGLLKNSTLGQMFDLIMGQGSAPTVYTSTQTLSSPLQNYSVLNSSSAFTLTFPKLNGIARGGQQFIYYNENTGTVTFKNNAGTTVFSVLGGQIIQAFVSFIDGSGGGADNFYVYEIPYSNLTHTNGLAYYNGTQLSTVSTTTVNSDGSITNTAQPFVSVWQSSSTSSVTGDGTNYPVVFDNVYKQQGSGYNNVSGVFTCQDAGNYRYSGQITVGGSINSNNTLGIINIQKSGSDNRTWQSDSQNVYATRDGNGNRCMLYDITIPLAINDQVLVGIEINGNSSKNVAVLGNGNPVLTYLFIEKVS